MSQSHNQKAWRAAAYARLCLRGAALALVAPAAALADTPSFTVSPDQPLRFGTLIVPATGSRTITAEGIVTSSGLLSYGNEPVGPAQFTITYDRGVNSNQPINVMVQVMIAGSQTVNIGGVTGKMSAFDTNLPSNSGRPAGPVVNFTIANCTQRRCSQTFRVGARLDITRANGGASLVFPVPLTAHVLRVF